MVARSPSKPVVNPPHEGAYRSDTGEAIHVLLMFSSIESVCLSLADLFDPSQSGS